ncbi:MAG: GTP cyclohydrolase I FolE2 [Chthoniobacterales bacterium]|jgi:GTP cyclohydrolase IB|nr:GTP cyclohydrolase I FolE2 [Chthoniobacterales bacterium]
MKRPDDHGTALRDTQSESDHRRIVIDRVGVKNLRFPIQVAVGPGEPQSTIATVQLTVELPQEFKGTHMSRFLEVLQAHGPVLHPEDIEHLLASLLGRLHSKRSHLEFEFPFFLEKKAPVTGAPGLVDYTACFSATSDGESHDLVTTVVANVTTLCPCSKAISETGAHNQRGQVTLRLRSKKPLPLAEMVSLIESSASSELYSVLKRPDEKAVTERAYANPVFVEDLVRNVAAKVIADSRITWWQVEAENFESIHNHNAYALVEKHT